MAQSKAVYNKLLKRYDKAVKWFNNPKTTEAEKDKFEPLFLEIVHELAVMADELIKDGVRMTNKEIREGFTSAQKS